MSRLSSDTLQRSCLFVMRPIVNTIALCITLLASGEPAHAQIATGSTDALPAAVYWGQDVFIIPYQWSARTDPATAKEVVLYMSSDLGASWSEVTRARPDVRSFLYRSTGDGEYWFAVRTLDNHGRMWPAGGYQPELRVVVDTRIPTAEIQTATLSRAGTVQVVGQISDANLDTSTLKLAMRPTGSADWIQLQPRLETTATPGEVRVVAAGQAPAGVGELTLRMAVQDLAGNPAGAGKRVTASTAPTTTQVPRRALPSAEPNGDPFLSAPPLELPADPRSVAQPVVTSPPIVDTAAPFADSGSTDSPWRSASTVRSGPRQTPAAGPPQVAASQPWPVDQRSQTPFHADSPHSWQPPRRAAVVATRPAAGEGGGLDRSPYHQASAGRHQADGFLPSELTDIDSVASGQQLMVNQRQFALDYDLQSAGKWGVSKVEVWGSPNGGQTWKHFATDSDNRTPVNIVAPGPGKYGFRILVQGVGSLPVEPPRPGDLPEVSVIVDTEPPAARLTSASQGEGYFGDHLIVAWQAADQHLEPRPIALSYSDGPSGPWIPMASNLANETAIGGQYTWRLQRHLPRQLYIRLEVRDQAGNVAVDMTRTPIQLEFNQPAGRIRAARPIAESL